MANDDLHDRTPCEPARAGGQSWAGNSAARTVSFFVGEGSVAVIIGVILVLSGGLRFLNEILAVSAN